MNTLEEQEELKNLAVSAGAKVISCIIHSQNDINPKYYISTGKLEEIKGIVSQYDCELIIFDNDLTPGQESNIEQKLGIKIIDRTRLILDIFAQRARSSEGKLQVELAQLNYLLPRLRGKGMELSRLGGGIGTRGPGEQKLEVDRRKIRKRIAQLESRINKIAVQRETQRKQRQEKQIFLASLVGYTNSGKSTLLNTLTRSDAFVKNMVFSTLDSTTRKIKIPEIDEILISDTVGFIEKLPHQLVAAFKSTLEEVKKSDLLLLIVDSSSANYENHIKSVMNVLKEIDVTHKTIIIVFNKIDLLDRSKLEKMKLKYKNAVFISALNNSGLKNLYEKIKYNVDKKRLEVYLKIPYSEAGDISFVYRNCKIIEKKYLEDSLLLLVNINPEIMGKMKKYLYRKK
ncbi:MAG: GTPase HflX [Actinobacteria bacterium]|nr:GTPase HflX [Actinomycetota bacterium]